MLHRIILAATLAAVSAGLLPAASVTYADWAAWQSAAPNSTLIDFEGLTADFISYNTSAGLTVGGAQFVGVAENGSYRLYVVNPAAHPDHDFGTGSVLKGPEYVDGYSAVLQILLPDVTTAVAFDLGTYNTTASSVYTVLLDTGEQFPGISVGARPEMAFFGITSDVPFTQVDILMTAGASWISAPILDNVAYGVASTGGGTAGAPQETPEAATFLLVGSGLICFWRWRRRAPQPAA